MDNSISNRLEHSDSKIQKFSDYNRFCETKYRDMMQKREDDIEQTYLDYEKYEEKKDKRLRGIYRSMHRMWTDFKQSRAD